jgi:hypothetical protein
MEVQAEIAKARPDRENSAASGETIEYHFVGIRVNSKTISNHAAMKVSLAYLAICRMASA